MPTLWAACVLSTLQLSNSLLPCIGLPWLLCCGFQALACTWMHARTAAGCWVLNSLQPARHCVGLRQDWQAASQRTVLCVQLHLQLHRCSQMHAPMPLVCPQSQPPRLLRGPVTLPPPAPVRPLGMITAPPAFVNDTSRRMTQTPPGSDLVHVQEQRDLNPRPRIWQCRVTLRVRSGAG
jgi:hypothetical protein